MTGTPASPADGPPADRLPPEGVGAHPLAVRAGLTVTAALTILDQATKEIAEATLDRGRFVSLLGEGIGWQLVYNPGGAFGLPAPPWLFLVVTLVVVVLVVRALPRTTSLLSAVAYGMLLAGALGNVIDRLVRPGAADDRGVAGGYVVDFVAWGSFPRFNVADSAITVGFVLLVVALFLEERRMEAAADRASGTPRDRRDRAEDPTDDPTDGP